MPGLYRRENESARAKYGASWRKFLFSTVIGRPCAILLYNIGCLGSQQTRSASCTLLFHFITLPGPRSNLCLPVFLS